MAVNSGGVELFTTWWQRHVYDALLDWGGIARTWMILKQIQVNGEYSRATTNSVTNALCVLRGRGLVCGPEHGLWWIPVGKNRVKPKMTWRDQ